MPRVIRTPYQDISPMCHVIAKSLWYEFTPWFKKPDRTRWRRFQKYYNSLPKKRGYVVQ